MDTNNSGSRSNSEGGHAKNVAQFQKVITRCESLPEFNPPNPIIYLVELKKYHIKADNAIVSVHEHKSTSDIAINDRQIEFARLDSVATRTVNILEVIANEKKIVADAKTILRRIRGEASKPKTDENNPGQETREPRSNSQQSYDKRIDHFVALIELVKQIPGYEPNKKNLQLQGLQLTMQSWSCETTVSSKQMHSFQKPEKKETKSFTTIQMVFSNVRSS